MSNTEALIAHYVTQHAPTGRWHAHECGVGAFAIDAQGRWFHEGTPIGREGLVKLLASVLCYEQGQYLLKSPSETCPVAVADSPFLIVAWQYCELAPTLGLGPTLIAQDNLGRLWPVCGEFPLVLKSYQGQSVPYLMLNYGLSARVGRSVYYQWAELAQSQGEAFVLTSADTPFVIG
ncbi:DUF1285 domain-containing protein [Pseudoalteromonas sp. DL2-H2.2]|uniref:DUF1285 domain-containing protein n=1 Tax=Pseudoalteromonas sp. DL2-H2.2 TaxID=2908889 RepID=UPI001F18E554|nr:DUF1285 domain-containing protein [Pseudoalteromonas sp. DL2-H2.2]MCF2908720.1 DUF1285 domain-containing protein [Pseudoalteromonas sp. DL2-H2.2]